MAGNRPSFCVHIKKVFFASKSVEDKNLILPFNENKWSKYSFKKSKYILTPLQIEQNIEEEAKDPRNIEI